MAKTQWDPSSFMGEASIADPLYAYLLDQLTPGRLLDIGSGRGRFLQAARARGFEVLGVDGDAASVEYSSAQGAPAVCEDVWKYLEDQDETYDVISAIHFVEHFEPADTSRLIAGMAELLRPGGTLVLVTPNFRDWRIASEVFWLDPTHVRPYPLLLLEQMVEAVGLTPVLSTTRSLLEVGLKTKAVRPFMRLRHGLQYDLGNAVLMARRPKAES
jgi:2-polyprenyl-3-methyl-5-hydroxy-6-metoxy-1,4-benzoquinol methylase